MPLPADDTPWPPRELTQAANVMREHDAWYSGDPGRLAEVYGGQGATMYGNPNAEVYQRRRDSSISTRAITYVKRFFWGKANNDASAQNTRLHAPLASDIASASADLCFSDTPSITIPGADDNGADGSAARASQDRLDYLVEANRVPTLLLEGGEVGAALGGYGVRISWDQTLIGDRPILSIVHGDQTWPEYSFGILTAITFWREVRAEGQVIWRQLERQERGKTFHALYEGTAISLGKQRALSALTDTAALLPEVDGIEDRLLAAYVPNMLPNRKYRHSPFGRSDYAGVEPMLDAFDETWSSWMRDIRTGKSRIMLPESWMRPTGDGGGGAFDSEQEVFAGLPGLMQSDTSSPAGMITQSQFKIRTEDHAKTCAELFRTIIGSAGYSPSTFGLTDGSSSGPITAREISSRDRRSLITRERKNGYTLPEWREILFTLQLVDAKLFASARKGAEPIRPDVQPAPAVQESARELAETVNLVHQAEAASRTVRVRMMHPDWTSDQVEAEVTELAAESALSDPATFTGDDPNGPPAFGG